MPRGRVYHHPRWLVHHQHILILEYHGERDVLGDNLSTDGGWNLDHDAFARTRLVARLFATTVHRHATLGDERRRLVARQIELGGDEDVETRRVVGRDEL